MKSSQRRHKAALAAARQSGFDAGADEITKRFMAIIEQRDQTIKDQAAKLNDKFAAARTQQRQIAFELINAVKYIVDP